MATRLNTPITVRIGNIPPGQLQPTSYDVFRTWAEVVNVRAQQLVIGDILTEAQVRRVFRFRAIPGRFETDLIPNGSVYLGHHADDAGFDSLERWDIVDSDLQDRHILATALLA